LSIKTRGERLAETSRQGIAQAQRVLLKVGTAVVTRDDGRLALARLGALVETISALRNEGRDIVLVSSGSIGLGANYLDLTRPLEPADCPVAAAAGQSLLMEKYRQLFGNLDLRCAQVLLTEDDFSNPHRLANLASTLERLLALGSVPIVNENDAVTAAIKMEHKQGVFYDNDRLAGLTATALKADALVILSDVDALYSEPPNHKAARRIANFEGYNGLSFGSSGDMGRGGMRSKVDAAKRTAESGVPVVITSGLRAEALKRVLQGLDEGTFFAPTIEA
jgi:delta-1-pyrroline-5-carboxylate synthetase